MAPNRDNKNGSKCPDDAKGKPKHPNPNWIPKGPDPSKMKISNLSVLVGPPTTVGEVLNAKPGDPPPQWQDELIEPSIEELYWHCRSKLDGKATFGVKPVLGPERPPAQEKK